VDEEALTPESLLVALDDVRENHDSILSGIQSLGIESATNKIVEMINVYKGSTAL
jgi:hypothetical protein